MTTGLLVNGIQCTIDVSHKNGVDGCEWWGSWDRSAICPFCWIKKPQLSKGEIEIGKSSQIFPIFFCDGFPYLCVVLLPPGSPGSNSVENTTDRGALGRSVSKHTAATLSEDCVPLIPEIGVEPGELVTRICLAFQIFWGCKNLIILLCIQKYDCSLIELATD